MKEEIINLFLNNDQALTKNDIKKHLGISHSHKEEELKNILFELELAGYIYSNNDVYTNFPADFFIRPIEVFSKGKP